MDQVSRLSRRRYWCLTRFHPVYYGKLLVRTPEDMPMLGMTDTAEHLKRRRPWARAFSGAALKEYEPMVASRALQLVQALQSQPGEIDIGKWINYFRCATFCFSLEQLIDAQRVR